MLDKNKVESVSRNYLTPNESEFALLSGMKCETDIGAETAAKKLIC